MRLKLTEWHRETFAVHVFDRSPTKDKGHRAELARGWVSGCFGVYAGDLYHVGHERPGPKVYSLVHMPSQVVQFTLPRMGLCRQAAEELASCDLAWESAWGPGVVGPPEEMEKAREIHNRWRSFGVRKTWGTPPEASLSGRVRSRPAKGSGDK